MERPPSFVASETPIFSEGLRAIRHPAALSIISKKKSKLKSHSCTDGRIDIHVIIRNKKKRRRAWSVSSILLLFGSEQQSTSIYATEIKFSRIRNWH